MITLLGHALLLAWSPALRPAPPPPAHADISVSFSAHTAARRGLPAALLSELPEGRALEEYPALRGPVAEGFGRGSRKLGIPTANLPCSLFQSELAPLACGVYVGWAAVRGSRCKCVVNVGFSPTFTEQNKEKVVEAHLMASDGSPADIGADFYGEELSLLLLGYVRPERKFDGLPQLLETIRADIQTAARELDSAAYALLADAAWLRPPSGSAPEFRMLPLESGELRPGPAAARAGAAGAEPEGAPAGAPAPDGFEWGATY